MKAMKKFSFVSLMVLLLVQCVVAPAYANAADPTNGGLIVTDNILKSAQLTFKSSTGQTLNSVTTESIIQVDYTWELPNGHKYVDGATYTFQLPAELEVYEVINNSPVKFNGVEIGKFSVALDGTAKVVFNDFIENNSNIKGTLQVLSQINETAEMNEDKQVIVTPVQGGAELAIPIDFKPGGSPITKDWDRDRDYNTQKVTWTIDLNRNLATIDNAILTDIVDDPGMIPDLNSIVVYNLNSRVDGKLTQGTVTDAVYYEVNPIIGSNDFTIEFNQPIKTAYRVVYNTTITNDSTSYKNTAKLSGDNYTEKSIDATVTVGRGKPLEKTSRYDSVTQSVYWTIKYNYNSKVIPKLEALLTDTFGDTHEYVANSLKVERVTLDADGKEIPSATTPETDYQQPVMTSDPIKKTNGFNLQFNNDVTGPLKITYTTKAKDRVFENGKVGNTVVMGSTVTGSVYKEQNITQQILTKTYKNANYNTKKASWQIDFNKDKYTMTNVKLVDTFTNGGMTLDVGSVVIQDATRGTLVAGTHYTVTKTANGFEIEFIGTISDRLTITYDTDFNYDARTDKNITNLPNKGHFSWDYNNNGTVSSQSKEAIDIFTPDSYTQSNGFKNGKYDAASKKITWSIGINYNLQTLTKPWVKDEIIGDQDLDKTSLKVYKVSLTGGANGIGTLTPMLEGTDYTVSWDPAGKSGFEVKFTNSINEAYMITYDTSLVGKEIKSSYSNTATLYNNDGTTKVTDLISNPVSVPHGDQYVTKSGLQNGKIIDWTMQINYGQSTVEEAKITDLPSDNQSLIEDSFQLLSTTVTADGTVLEGTALTKGTDYDLVFQKKAGKDEFVLTFKNTINEPYVLKYKSLILAAAGDQVSNKADFSGKNLKTTNTQGQHNITVRLTTGMGTGQGEVGSLEVVKVDKAVPTQVLEGAEFSLIDEQSGVTIKKATTDADGKIVFSKLLYGDYLLVEGKAPTGYTINTNSTTRVTLNNQSQSQTVTNEKIIQAVQLTKVDKGDNTVKLQGATFDLQQDQGSGYITIDSRTSDLNGQITFNNLQPGNYQFVETGAPANYVLDNSPIQFTITSNQTTIIPVKHENVQGVGSLTVHKQDKADQSALEGAVFELYDSNGYKDSQTTNAAGEAVFINLPYGSYTLKETQAPTGYVIDATESMKTVVVNGTVTGENTDVTVTNNKIIMSFKLTKVDANNPQKVLEGAVFQLLYKQFAVDPYVVVTGKEALTTDQSGIIIEDNLLEGFYQLIEVTAPEGYILDNTPIEFTIDKDQTAVKEFDMKNKVVPTNPGTPGGGTTDPGTDPGTNPGTPVGPTDPGTNPGTPTDPSNPGNNGGTTDPGTDPSTPVDPTDPTDPGNNGGTTTPETPGGSTDPDQPGNNNGSDGNSNGDNGSGGTTTPIQPGNPEDSKGDGQTSTPDQTGQVPGSNKPKDPQGNKGSNETLPQTSGESYYGLTAAGIALMLFGLSIMFYRKRNKA